MLNHINCRNGSNLNIKQRLFILHFNNSLPHQNTIIMINLTITQSGAIFYKSIKTQTQTQTLNQQNYCLAFQQNNMTKQLSVFVKSHLQIHLPSHLSLKEILLLQNGHLGLIFSGYYAYYNIKSAQIKSITKLPFELENPRTINNNIVALSTNKNRIIIIKGDSGETLFQSITSVDEQFLVEEFQLIVFQKTNLIVLIFKQEFMLLKKLIVLNSSLEVLSTRLIQIPFLIKYDDTNSLIGYNQVIQNQLKLQFFNLQTWVKQTVEILEVIPEIKKSMLITVRKISDSMCIMGFNYVDRGEWYVLNLENNTIKLFYTGLCIAQVLKWQHKTHEIHFFGYNPKQKKPSAMVVTVGQDSQDQIEIKFFPNSNFNYQDSNYVLLYKPCLKPTNIIELQTLQKIRKRALVLHVALNSHLANYGSFLLRSLLQVTELQKRVAQKESKNFEKVAGISSKLKQVVNQ